MSDTKGSQMLSEEECFRLLEKASIGRIVYTDRAMPAIRPVLFRVDDRAVIIATTDGALVSATRGAVVAFEVDEFERDGTGSGWTVVAVGKALETAPATVDPTERASLRQVSTSADERYLRIEIELISGRLLLGPTSPGSE
jgi:hypothetical protein